MTIKPIPGEALTREQYYRIEAEKERLKTLPRVIPEPKPKKELTEAQKESRRKALAKWNKKRRKAAK